MLSKTEIREQISQAIDLIEKNTNRTIWRTSMRIHDLIILSNPTWENNQFLVHRQNFLYLLYNFCFSNSITAIAMPGVQQLWEKYEESIFEPTLFWDIHIEPQKDFEHPEKTRWILYKYTPIDVRSILTERRMFHFMKQWLNFEDANMATGAINPNERAAIVQEFINNGMLVWNIFYKYPHGANDKKSESLPQLPAYI